MTNPQQPHEDALTAAIAKNTRATRALVTILLVALGIPAAGVLVLLALYVYFTATT